MVENDYNLIHVFYIFVVSQNALVEEGKITNEEAIGNSVAIFGPFKQLLSSLLKHVPEEAKVNKELIQKWLTEMDCFLVDGKNILLDHDFLKKCKCPGHIWYRMETYCKRPLMHEIVGCDCIGVSNEVD